MDIVYDCSHVGCDASFKQKSQLDAHLATHDYLTGDLSSSAKEHQCPEADCVSSYASANALIKHRRAKHGYTTPTRSPKGNSFPSRAINHTNVLKVGVSLNVDPRRILYIIDNGSTVISRREYHRRRASLHRRRLLVVWQRAASAVLEDAVYLQRYLLEITKSSTLNWESSTLLPPAQEQSSRPMPWNSPSPGPYYMASPSLPSSTVSTPRSDELTSTQTSPSLMPAASFAYISTPPHEADLHIQEQSSYIDDMLETEPDVFFASQPLDWHSEGGC
ncbi:hypothetical protein BDZ89DRAFT_1220862 [Hymenopellis radicata]|nr:hypothetical protein BDZ89DRAFT_1220862 [Hymenopellis radicata]